MLVGVRRTGAIQFIKVLLLYGTPTNGVYSSSMAAKKMGKAAPGAAKAVKSTGAPAKLANIVTGKKVVVHGSPTKGLKSITPTSGSRGAPGETVAWGWNPAKKGAKTAIANNAQGYSQGSGSLYVAKASKRATKFSEGSSKAITKSTKPMKVVKEIQVANKSQTQIQKELKDALKKSGSPAKGTGVKGKVKQAKTKAQNKNKNSVV
jgi:hypothetical protein